MLVALATALTACTSLEVATSTTLTDSTTPTSPTTSMVTTTSTSTPTLTLREREVREYTSFTPTTDCDPMAEDADLQVVQAFFTAYNERNLERLTELTEGDTMNLTDMTGIPHLGADTWSGVRNWAEIGWEVNDQFELTLLVGYDPLSGSEFELNRTNDVLTTSGIDSVRHSGKVHSSRCSISQMVLYLPFPETPDSNECLFYSVFADELAERTDQQITQDEECTN